MRVHLLALPTVQTTRAYALDGFCNLTISFARLLERLGHHVFLYASEENEAPCDELITVVTKEEQDVLLGMGPWAYQHANIDEGSPLFQLANARTAIAIDRRKEPGDVICQIGGWSQHYVSDKHPDLATIEYSIGYLGSFADYRVFESVSHQHETYGRQGITDVRLGDTVIPCFFDPDRFPYRETKDPVYVYCGRIIQRKGVTIACEAAKAAGVDLKLIGHTSDRKDLDLISYGEYLGALSPESKNDWLSRATAVFTPTTYLEPFNCVAVEAQLCGTPVIATDCGGFTDTIEAGRTGYRCSTLREFVDAIRNVSTLDPSYIRARALNLYTLTAVEPLYATYFARVQQLRDRGWQYLERTRPTVRAAEVRV